MSSSAQIGAGELERSAPAKNPKLEFPAFMLHFKENQTLALEHPLAKKAHTPRGNLRSVWRIPDNRNSVAN
jgi:hypothetical protein